MFGRKQRLIGELEFKNAVLSTQITWSKREEAERLSREAFKTLISTFNAPGALDERGAYDAASDFVDGRIRRYNLWTPTSSIS